MPRLYNTRGNMDDTRILELGAELAKARAREKDAKESGSAMLFMLEDLERSREEIKSGKQEWEQTVNLPFLVPVKSGVFRLIINSQIFSWSQKISRDSDR